MKEQLMQYYIEGDLNSENMVLFLHGFPDTHHLWDDIIKETKNALIINMTYPNYYENQKLETEDIIQRIYNLIQKYDKNHTKKRIIGLFYNIK